MRKILLLKFAMIFISLFFQGSQETDPDEEMGLIGAVADDTEAEYIRFVCETEIIKNDNLLGILK